MRNSSLVEFAKRRFTPKSFRSACQLARLRHDNLKPLCFLVVRPLSMPKVRRRSIRPSLASASRSSAFATDSKQWLRRWVERLHALGSPNLVAQNCRFVIQASCLTGSRQRNPCGCHTATPYPWRRKVSRLQPPQLVLQSRHSRTRLVALPVCSSILRCCTASMGNACSNTSCGISPDVHATGR